MPVISTMNAVPAHISATLQQHGQAHLLRWWDTLDEAAQAELLRQLEQVDFAQLAAVFSQNSSAAEADPAAAPADTQRADRATAPTHVIRQPQSAADQAVWAAAAATGELLLQQGRVAVITVAGGQGSRLGFEHPKGMFPIGPVSDRSLFQIFAEQILARRRRHGGSIPWLIMTSDATHTETLRFFEQNNWFGLDPATVTFFQQGTLPALDARTGQILLEDRGRLCLSPDGHGGLISALSRSGLLQRLAGAGVDHLFYHQVDNPTAILCDPALIGFHAQQQSSLTTSVVRKLTPTERMGVLADLDGRTEIIEYSELTPQQAAREDAAGQWIFWAGNTAIHVFTRTFLEQLAEDGCRLPLHIARKAVPHLDDNGARWQPQPGAPPNGIKLERFIFDALPLAPRTLIVEGNRPREFNPVKNRDGADSPATARSALSRIAREWLHSAGVPVADDQPVEISPLVALDAAELQQRLASGEIHADRLLQST